MNMTQRPATVLERAIARGQQGSADPTTVLWVLAADTVVILHEGALPENEFPPRPMTVTNGKDQFLAVFTHQDFTAELAEGREVVLVPALELLRRIPPSVGLVVNPGAKLGLEVPSEGIRGFAQMLMETEVQA